MWMTSWSRRSRGCKLCSSLHDAALSGRDDRGPEACQTALSHQVSRGRSSRAEQREVRDRVEDFTKSEIQKCHHSTMRPASHFMMGVSLAGNGAWTRSTTKPPETGGLIE